MSIKEIKAAADRIADATFPEGSGEISATQRYNLSLSIQIAIINTSARPLAEHRTMLAALKEIRDHGCGEAVVVAAKALSGVEDSNNAA